MKINYHNIKNKYIFFKNTKKKKIFNNYCLKSNPNPFYSTNNLPYTTVYFLLLAKKKNY